MWPRLLLLALPIAVGIGVLPTGAGAAPLTQSRIAVADVRIALPHGHHLELSLRLTSLDGAERLRVEARRCSARACGGLESFAGPVNASEVSASTAHARLRTLLDGLPLSVGWSPAGPGAVVIGGSESSSDGSGTTFSTYRGDAAVVKVVLGDTMCSARGAVGDELRVSDSDNDAAVPMAELELPRGVVTC